MYQRLVEISKILFNFIIHILNLLFKYYESKISKLVFNFINTLATSPPSSCFLVAPHSSAAYFKKTRLKLN